MTILECQFVKLNEKAIIPTLGTDKSIGMDLYVLENFGIYPNQFRLIETGLIAIPPVGFHFEILLRSSTGKRYPGLILANHVGLIDPTYCGEKDQIKLAFYNCGNQHIFVESNKPIAQFVLRENIFGEPIEITTETYEKYSCSRRTRGGFGSTDKKVQIV